VQRAYPVTGAVIHRMSNARFSVSVPEDAVASIDPKLGDAALEMMRRNVRTEILSASTALSRVGGNRRVAGWMAFGSPHAQDASRM
jgi:hypothetical protein